MPPVSDSCYVASSRQTFRSVVFCSADRLCHYDGCAPRRRIQCCSTSLLKNRQMSGRWRVLVAYLRDSAAGEWYIPIMAYSTVYSTDTQSGLHNATNAKTSLKPVKGPWGPDSVILSSISSSTPSLLWTSRFADIRPCGTGGCSSMVVHLLIGPPSLSRLAGVGPDSRRQDSEEIRKLQVVIYLLCTAPSAPEPTSSPCIPQRPYDRDFQTCSCNDFTQ